MTVEQYAEFCEKLYKPDKDAKDLLLQAYKRGRAESLVEALKPYDAESVEDLVRNVRNKTIKDVLQTIRNGMSELLESPWANGSYMSSHDFEVRETMSIIDDLILKKDIEQMKEGAENDHCRMP